MISPNLLVAHGEAAIRVSELLQIRLVISPVPRTTNWTNSKQSSRRTPLLRQEQTFAGN
jgi:hypothetical protein